MFAVYLFFTVLWAIVRGFGLGALVITVLLTLAAGLVTYLSGGNAITGMLWTGGICLALSAGAAVLGTFAALSRPW